MGKMLDNIAHQWRQPLMSISASLLNLQREDELKTLSSQSLEHYIDNIESTTSYMSNTIDDFRNFFKHDNMKESSDITHIVTSVLKLIRTTTKDIRINTTIDIHEHATFFRGEMTQVLISLLVNAAETMKIHHIEDPTIHIIGSCDQESYKISIEDNGGGIKENDLTKIFNPYFTTKQSTGGSGLGLYTCKIIIENHFNGQITVQNTQNGAKFTLIIPKENV